MYIFYTKNLCWPCCHIPKILLIMKLTTVLLIATIMQVSASSRAQQVTLKRDKITLSQLFKEISRQTGYSVIWSGVEEKNTIKVSVNFFRTPLEEVLRTSLEAKELSYELDSKTIIIKAKEKSLLERVIDRFQEIDVRGKVIDESGQPMVGASIIIKGTSRMARTNENGEFNLNGVDEKAILVISYLGYQTEEIGAKKEMGTVKLTQANSKLDEVIVQAYGTTTMRKNTGNITTISSKEIENQPVSNPLAALIGRVPGVVISQSSGVPGSAFNVEIRGRGSLDQSLSQNNPLIVIDGVFFEPGNSPSNQLRSAANNQFGEGGLSPLNSFNPADIASIEVLKDADATAIYGSRGANGVILITTKKGKSGRTELNANVYSGWSNVTRTMDMLNTQQYVQMRKEGFKNDGITPSSNPLDPGYAPG